MKAIAFTAPGDIEPAVDAAIWKLGRTQRASASLAANRAGMPTRSNRHDDDPIDAAQFTQYLMLHEKR